MNIDEMILNMSDPFALDTETRQAIATKLREQEARLQAADVLASEMENEFDMGATDSNQISWPLHSAWLAFRAAGKE